MRIFEYWIEVGGHRTEGEIEVPDNLPEAEQWKAAEEEVKARIEYDFVPKF